MGSAASVGKVSPAAGQPCVMSFYEFHFIFKDFEDINKGIVNSQMYKKQAKRFCNTSKNDHAIKYLSLGINGIS